MQGRSQLSSREKVGRTFFGGKFRFVSGLLFLGQVTVNFDV